MIELRPVTRRVRTFAGLTLAGLLILSSFAAQFVNRAKAEQGKVITPDIPPGEAYRQTNLVSDAGGLAAITDPLLRNPWGIGGGWVANNRTSTSRAYHGDVSGSPFVGFGFDGSTSLATLTIPGNDPTGVVKNTTSDFGGGGFSTTIIFASLTGNIIRKPLLLGGTFQPIAVNAVSQPGHSYTGLAIGNNGSANFLYAANVASPTLAGSIETFNRLFEVQSVASFPFNDTGAPAIPADFRPFNITNIGSVLYVSYARNPCGTLCLTTGPGLGFVSKFDMNGAFLGRVISNGALNAPWGMAQAPASFGTFGGAFLVGNVGDGKINAYNSSGALLGTLSDEAGVPIVLDRLRSLVFGDGSTGDPTTLYFTAGIGSESRGLLGSLKPTTASATSLIQFSSDTFTIGEGGGHADITVTRVGDVSGPATVNYATWNPFTTPGPASLQSDYEMAAGKLTFNPGETSKTVSVLIVDDNLVEGGETVNLALSNPTGAGVGLGAPNQATLGIIDNDASPSTANPIDDASFFVRQQYLDFLNREPDPPGLSFWISNITSCGSDAGCIAVRRINVSAAFFLSIEFQNTGMLAYLANKAAFPDRWVLFSLPVVYGQFERDTQALQKNFVFGTPAADAVLEANKVAYFNDFVTRPEFVDQYPTSLTPASYVDRVMKNAGFSTDKSYQARLNGGQTVPPNASPATTLAFIDLNDAGTQIGSRFYIPSGLSSTLTGAQIHGPAAPGANGPLVADGIAGNELGSDAIITAVSSVTPAQVADLRAGRYYLDLHTTAFPGGEIRGQFPASAQAFRDSLITGLSASPATETRATVLRKIAESAEFRNREFNYAFVLMQYFGYLRRDPDTLGYNFWLGKLNLFGGSFIDAEMVKAFITSTEYRQRVGP